MSTAIKSPPGSAGAAAGINHQPDSPPILDRQRAAIRSLLAVIADRHRRETELATRYADQNRRADSEYQKTRVQKLAELDRLDAEAIQNDEKRRRAAIDEAIKGEQEAKAEFAAASRALTAHFDSFRETARSDHSQAKTKAQSVHDSALKKAKRERALKLKPLDDSDAHAEAIRERLAILAQEYRKFKLPAELPAAAAETYDRFPDLSEELFNRLAGMETPLRLLERLIIPAALKGGREAWVYLLVMIPFAGFALYFDGGIVGFVAALVAGGVIGFLVRFWLVQLASHQLTRLYLPLTQTLADALALAAHARALVEAEYQRQKNQIADQREKDLQAAQDRYRKTIAQGEEARDEKLRAINERYASRMVEVQTAQQKAVRAAIDAHDRRMAELKMQRETLIPQIDRDYQELKARIQEDYDQALAALEADWRAGLAQVRRELDVVAGELAQVAPDWDDPAWTDRPLPRTLPPALRFGTLTLDLAQIPHGLAVHPRLMEGVEPVCRTPALRAFPAAANLILEGPTEARSAALAVLQSSMMRLLTSLPPGLVRFTIIDPIGIGRNFGAFMHLADFDPALVTNQAWTEPKQIEDRLADLAAHMEMVTQRYLRNEYATLEEYNAVAGEVAEPYRVLVVADFPAKFDDAAAARLCSIASGGPPCGVLVLVAVDPARPLPDGFRLEYLRNHCAHLSLTAQGKPVWDDADFAQFPLAVDEPPRADFATREIQKVGRAAKDAKRVVVPFEFIAPAADSWWTGDTRDAIEVAIGKSGATKRQLFTLGQGTSQHVLLAGRTGSGKSTLMHALITNLALHYSPDEIDLYLIDFKKGVEFKVYAQLELPHASVVAIESEREFGVSVLERLDAELRLRAERFREAGVQDVSGYRAIPDAPPLPRIMLIVDEFQEFFIEEDKLAHEAALWLDRLVRQGRAFGIHVLLGSQSLAGAMALARSTIGQMAVRIALQCSESDAHLIMSENNTAPKMLSRPGEAIYNDANGAPEGNNFFQVVWLSDESRERYLSRLRELVQQRRPRLVRSPIVFEGDAAARLERSRPLLDRLAPGSWPEHPRSAPAWLGEAISIKDPTQALFRRQGGNHLLIVGQNDEAALGVAVAVLLSLAVQYPPASSDSIRQGARFFLLDGTPEDHPRTGTLGRVAALLPHGTRCGDWREIPELIAAVSAELTRRQETKTDGPEIFLFLHDLARFRDLRRREDEFSFSRKEESASPADQLDFILREGPVLGIHLVVWCDSVTNLNRHFTSQSLREFEMRVLFQMSPNDSGHMLESPVASKLGPHRAYFASEEQNRLEKFRPYGVPQTTWLEHLGQTLANRSTP